MKVLVCGGRTVGQVNPSLSGPAAGKDLSRASFERKFLTGYLSRMHEKTPITLLIAGEEGGAGSVGLNWAAANNVEAMPWRRLKFPKSTLLSSLTSIGKKQRSSDFAMETFEARNSRMVEGSQPDLVLAFGGGEATKLLVDLAKAKSVKVVEIEIPEFPLAAASLGAPDQAMQAPLF